MAGSTATAVATPTPRHQYRGAAETRQRSRKHHKQAELQRSRCDRDDAGPPLDASTTTPISLDRPLGPLAVGGASAITAAIEEKPLPPPKEALRQVQAATAAPAVADGQARREASTRDARSGGWVEGVWDSTQRHARVWGR